jgi:hypothetical protein
VVGLEEDDVGGVDAGGDEAVFHEQGELFE